MADMEKRKVLALESIAKSLKTIAAKASGGEEEDDLGQLPSEVSPWARPPVKPMGPDDL